MNNPPITYASAGVDIRSADLVKQRIAVLAKGTFTRGVIGGVGGFGALFSIGKTGKRSPVLVSSADGVGTKLKIAFATGHHRSVAADLVNHCVNDIAVLGAEPLFFLDYLATGRLNPLVIEQVIGGLSDACKANGCALIGGETAQMPGFYADGEYDLAGFIVGIVDQKKILNGSQIREGDILLGLPSVGLHTNGYSLARKLLLETAGYALKERVPQLGGTVADELLKPHRCYGKLLRSLTDAGTLSGAAHITGGGLPGNVPRILPRGLEARLYEGSWPTLPVFELLREIGSLPDEEMWLTFNMGIGMVLVIPPSKMKQAETLLRKRKEVFYQIGRIARGRRSLAFENQPLSLEMQKQRIKRKG
ncbi:MAG: phosphoribosylformylglycinamidine cyclo-ligase [Acidobacteria bacterium RIFCSPLOWO2_12_FULL_54_10]|nr:MAG: phosphoribosylformylglycinamidine cyclo-ligase [Acidobacteria bacterium RIFCSPLOWO2_12_FULL_54_10]